MVAKIKEENKREGWELVVVIFATCIVLFCMLSMISCKTQQPTIVEKVVTNTEFVDRHHYDSIYIDNYVFVDKGSDTIKVTETKIEYRYKVLTDSVEVLRVDSIPYTVEVVKEVERSLNKYEKTMIRLGWCLIVLLVGIVGYKMFKWYRKIRP